VGNPQAPHISSIFVFEYIVREYEVRPIQLTSSVYLSSPAELLNCRYKYSAAGRLNIIYSSEQLYARKLGNEKPEARTTRKNLLRPDRYSPVGGRCNHTVVSSVVVLRRTKSVLHYPTTDQYMTLVGITVSRVIRVIFQVSLQQRKRTSTLREPK